MDSNHVPPNATVTAAAHAKTTESMAALSVVPKTKRDQKRNLARLL